MLPISSNFMVCRDWSPILKQGEVSLPQNHLLEDLSALVCARDCGQSGYAKALRSKQRRMLFSLHPYACNAYDVTSKSVSTACMLMCIGHYAVEPRTEIDYHNSPPCNVEECG